MLRDGFYLHVLVVDHGVLDAVARDGLADVGAVLLVLEPASSMFFLVAYACMYVISHGNVFFPQHRSINEREVVVPTWPSARRRRRTAGPRTSSPAPPASGSRACSCWLYCCAFVCKCLSARNSWPFGPGPAWAGRILRPARWGGDDLHAAVGPEIEQDELASELLLKTQLRGVDPLERLGKIGAAQVELYTLCWNALR